MKINLSLINKSQIISVISKMFLYIDPKLIIHGERVAYIVSEMLRHGGTQLTIDKEKLIILSVLHDLGAYKTVEGGKMFSFDSKLIWSHSIYGYLFLKYMSPIGDEAEAILYHHLDYKYYKDIKSNYLDYAAFIHLADRVDLIIATSNGKCDFNEIIENSGIEFHPEYVKLFFKSQPEEITRALIHGSYKKKIQEIIDEIYVDFEDTFEYLKMMVFSIDFRSEYTVTHTINTTAISLELANRLGLSKEDKEKLFLGSVLHDVGKIAISSDIIEFQGKLTPEQMKIMKKHVSYTRNIIEGLVDEEVAKIAYRHHEKLDGSGYPEGLREADLSLIEQIAAVADVVSALTNKRSYKEAFSKEKTLKILYDLKLGGKLSPSICEVMIENYDEIMEIADVSRIPIVVMYKNMHEEFDRLNKKVQAMLMECNS